MAAKFLKIQNHHIFALVLSLTAHFVFGLTIKGRDGSEAGTGETGSISAQVFTVSIRNLSNPVVSSESLPTKANEELGATQSFSTERQAGAVQKEEAIPILSVLKQTEPRYFRLTELMEKPRILHRTMPDPAAVNNVPPQTAVLRLLINENGDVDRVLIEQSYLPQSAENALTSAFSKTKFYPGKIEGIPVKSQLRIEVQLDSLLAPS